MQGTLLTPEARLQQAGAIQPPAGVLGWLPPQFWRTQKEFYSYGANFLPLAASGTQTQTISIQSDTDFILLYVVGVATQTDNVTPLAFRPVLVELKDNSTGSTLTQSPTHYENLFGNAMAPGIFSIPYFLRANSSLAVTLQNLEANDRNYRLSFMGFRSAPGSDYASGKLR
jgi:hypothetical protein